MTTRNDSPLLLALLALALLAALALPGTAGAGPVADPEIVIPADPGCPVTRPRVAILDEGELWVWSRSDDVQTAAFEPRGTEPVRRDTFPNRRINLNIGLADNGRMGFMSWYDPFGPVVRQVDARGLPTGVNPRPDVGYGAEMAMGADGEMLAVWQNCTTGFFPVCSVYGQRLDAAGRSTGGFLIFPSDNAEAKAGPDVAALADGSFAVTFTEREELDRIMAFKVPAGSGEPIGPTVIAADRLSGSSVVDEVAAAGAVASWPGGAAFAWREPIESGFAVSWRLFDFDLTPVTPKLQSRGGGFPVDGPRGTRPFFEALERDPLLALASAPDGRLALVWVSNGSLAALITDPAGNVGQAPFAVNEAAGGSRNPDAAFGADGALTVVWDQGPIQNPPSQDCVIGSGSAIHGRRFIASGCTAGALCLLEDRFEVTVAWDDPFNGGSGVGRPVPLTTDTGSFWFFDAANLELMVKVLDGREINGHFWVFFGSLTNVAFELTVTDRLTGAERTYRNPPEIFASRGDTTAFAGG